jgi:3-deoxy-D-manno-octulosonic-acid transferase
MRLFYNIFIYGYGFLIRVAAPFYGQARQWLTGRKNLFRNMEKAVGKHEDVVWFHAASLGEFEQGRPVIEAFRETFPRYKILLTFFSPSGYELRKNYEGADYIFYFPMDKPRNARRFIRIFKPKLAVFIKYEYWYNTIRELSKNKIPLFFISAIFRKEQYFFKPGTKWFRNQLQKVTGFMVQDQTSSDLLHSIHIYHHQISGDTRFDRVLKIAHEKVDFPVIQQFTNHSEVMVCGSTWPADEDILRAYLKQNQKIKMILAPHKIDAEHIQEIRKKFNAFHPVLYSETKKTPVNEKSRVLIIDTLGILSYLYRFGQVAYVGGGFGSGIHNLLEAAVYGIPVIFGPHYKPFREAHDLLENGGGFTIQDKKSFFAVADRLFQQADFRIQAGQAAKQYVEKEAGATFRIIEKFKEYLVPQQKEKLSGNL